MKVIFFNDLPENLAGHLHVYPCESTTLFSQVPPFRQGCDVQAPSLVSAVAAESQLNSTLANLVKRAGEAVEELAPPISKGTGIPDKRTSSKHPVKPRVICSKPAETKSIY